MEAVRGGLAYRRPAACMMASTDSAGALPQMISTSAHPALSSSSRRRLHSQQRRTGRPNGHGPVNLVQNGERQHRRHIRRSIGCIGGGAGHAVCGDRHIELLLCRIVKERTLAKQRIIGILCADGKEDGTVFLLGKLRKILSGEEPFTGL